MDQATKRAFLLLVVAQALHSIEEYAFSLWEVLAPARFLSRLAGGPDLAFGFAAVNVAIVALAFLTWAVPVRRERPTAHALVWFWILLEGANGVGHLLLALIAGGYFPGLLTAPLLLGVASFLALRLLAPRQAA